LTPPCYQLSKAAGNGGSFFAGFPGKAIFAACDIPLETISSHSSSGGWTLRPGARNDLFIIKKSA